MNKKVLVVVKGQLQERWVDKGPAQAVNQGTQRIAEQGDLNMKLGHGLKVLAKRVVT